MNLRTITSNVVQRLRPTDKTKAIRRIAKRVYHNRLIMHWDGDADSDWDKAQIIHDAWEHRLMFWLHQPFVWIQARSSMLQALGAVAVPVVLFIAAQQYQKAHVHQEREYQNLLKQQEIERLRNQMVTDYLNQLSSNLITIEGDLSDPSNEKIRALMTVSTLTLLRDSDLDGERKIRVIKYLAQMDLLAVTIIEELKKSEESVSFSFATDSSKTLAIIESETFNVNLSGVEIDKADFIEVSLIGVDFFGATLKESSFIESYLNGADFRRTYFRDSSFIGINSRDADFSSAEFIESEFIESDFQRTKFVLANLSNSELVEVDFTDADLSSANLSNSELVEVDFTDADLSSANLSSSELVEVDFTGADLTRVKNLQESQLVQSILCNTRLPQGIDINPNRDCDNSK